MAKRIDEQADVGFLLDENGFPQVNEIEKLKAELNFQRVENKRLSVHAEQLESTVAKLKSVAQNFKEEKERLKRKVRDLQTKMVTSPSNLADSDSACSLRYGNASNIRAASSSSVNSSPALSPTRLKYAATPIVPKLAEKVRLKRDIISLNDVHGSDISSVGVVTTKLAEHLVEDIEEASEFGEQLRICNNSSLTKKEFRLELAKLRAKADHLKSQLGLLEATLVESKTHNENLTMICAQLESNQTALRMSLTCAERIQEIFDCLLMLAETQLSLTLATYHASVHNSSATAIEHTEINKMLLTARHQRTTAEMIASQLYKRLQNSSSNDSLLSFSKKMDGLVDQVEESFTMEKEDALREYCSRLKRRKDAIQSTVLPVSKSLCESLEQDFFSLDRNSTSSSLQEQRLHLENAVLLQELSALKEGRADLRAQIYLLEKENELNNLALMKKDSEIEAHRLRFDQLTAYLNEVKSQNGFENGRLETLFESKLNELSVALDEITKTGETRAKKSEDLINDLKRANGALLAGFERSKRKHQNKIYRLYQQLALTSERYQTQLNEMNADRKQPFDLDTANKVQTCVSSESKI